MIDVKSSSNIKKGYLAHVLNVPYARFRQFQEV